MGTEQVNTELREVHTVLAQRAGALEFAAAGSPIGSGPTSRMSMPRVSPAAAAAGNAKAAGKQATGTPPTGSCRLCLTLNFFFDGTGNNFAADVGTNQQSNVAKLFQSRLDDDSTLNRFSFYVPGIGTYFREINDNGHTPRGLGMGAQGQDRIEWALKKFTSAVQAAQVRAEIIRIGVNVFGFSRGATAARAFVRDLAGKCSLKNGAYRLIAGGCPAEVTFLGIFDTVASVGMPMSANTTPFARTAGLYTNETTLRIRAEMSAAPLLEIAFGEPGADPAPGSFDGHASWADGLRINAPTFVKKCVHMVAAHEIRNSFPSDSALDGRTYSSGVSEMVYPGAHSDVGGGYQPGEGARSSSVGEMLSLVPLLAMHALAREAGVPLDSLESLRRDSSISPYFGLDGDGSKLVAETARLLKSYGRVAGSGGRNIGDELLAHSSWYLRWHFFNVRRNEQAKGKGPDVQRIRQREPGFRAERDRMAVDIAERQSAYKRAESAAQRAQNDLDVREMAQARYGVQVPPDVRQRAADTAARRDAAKDAYLSKKAELDTHANDSELIANMTVYDKRLVEDARTIHEHHRANPHLKLRPHYKNLVDAYLNHYVNHAPLDTDIVAFFDRYVHDSLAGFAMDSTLPSDPRVVYAGGDNKIRYAAVDTPTSRDTATA